jgi:nucleoprotein TPR
MLVNRGSIKMTEVDLATARSHVEQFKDISQASEAAFEKINEAYEDYKKTAEARLSQKEVCINMNKR